MFTLRSIVERLEILSRIVLRGRPRSVKGPLILRETAVLKSVFTSVPAWRVESLRRDGVLYDLWTAESAPCN